MGPTDGTILEQIVAAIRKVAVELPRGTKDSAWTYAIKCGLLKLGQHHGFSVCASGLDCEREWLFDMVWYKNDPQKRLQEIGLVMECEWDKKPDGIRYDFEKLLVAKSPIKLMVFQDNGDGNLPELLSQLENGIRAFKGEQSNETYILAAFRNASYNFEFTRIATSIS